MSLVCGRLNNRKARIARQERDKQRQTEGDVLTTRSEKSRRSVASDDMDSPAEVSPRLTEDDIDHGEVGPLKLSLRTPGTPSNAGSEGDEDKSDSSLVKTWRIDDVVSLRGEDDEEMAVGKIIQVEGSWQKYSLEEKKLCVVEVSDLKVEKATKIPFPSSMTGTSFEEAETLGGKSCVTWDIDHMYRVTTASALSPPLFKEAVNSLS